MTLIPNDRVSETWCGVGLDQQVGNNYLALFSICFGGIEIVRYILWVL